MTNHLSIYWHKVCFSLSLVLLISSGVAQTPPPVVSLLSTPICDIREVQVAFSPRGDAPALVLRELKAARQSVDVAMFYVTSRDMVDALCYLSSQQKIHVRLITDVSMGSPAQQPLLEELARYGIEIYLLQLPDGGKMHLKCLVVDGQTVVTGTANWTQQSFAGNFEDTLCIPSRSLAERYLRTMNALIAKSEPLIAYDSDLGQLPRADYPRLADDKISIPPDRVNAPSIRMIQDVNQLEVFFTPSPEGVSKLKGQILNAKKRIDLGMYFINDPELIEALCAVAREGKCEVRLLVDKIMTSQGFLNILQQLSEAGVTIGYFGSDRELLHLKTAVIDDRYVWTGSANWTQGALGLNAEEMICFDSPALACCYRSYLDSIAKITEPFIPTSREIPASATKILPTHDTSGFLVGLPVTGARTNWNDLSTPVDFPAFDVDAFVRYLPDDQYVPTLLDLLRSANQTILIAMYEFPAPSASGRSVLQEQVACQLESAAARGVYVRLILYMPGSPDDRLHEDHSNWAERLRKKGVDVRLSLPTRDLHDKCVVVDLYKVLIGSHNWSEGALSGKRVFESSALIVLPRQDIRLAEYMFSLATISDMRNKEAWMREAALVTEIFGMSGPELDRLIQSLSEPAP